MSNRKPVVRTETKGWSKDSVRSNLRFLYSVDERQLEGLQGVALTLTVRDCPPTAVDWKRMREAFFTNLQRDRKHLVHWVTEWQRRGVPHLHLAVYALDGKFVDTPRLLGHWLRISEPYRSRSWGQHSHPIYDVLGWNQYVSKHAARGLHHYQRSPENVPQGWQGGSTGRMWGYLGDWPVQESIDLEIDRRAFWRYRRIVRAWRKADARKFMSSGKVDTRRIRSARRMLRCPNRMLSTVRGCSEWMGHEITLKVLAHLSEDGHRISC